jgi:hypothetical protein
MSFPLLISGIFVGLGVVWCSGWWGLGGALGCGWCSGQMVTSLLLVVFQACRNQRPDRLMSDFIFFLLCFLVLSRGHQFTLGL